MKVITTREIVRQTKMFLELAEKERVAIKRGKKYVNLVVTDDLDTRIFTEDWIKEFLSIPTEYRCDPFEYSSSGDLFYADKRNIEHINKAIEQAKKGKTKKLSKEDQKKLFKI